MPDYGFWCCLRVAGGGCLVLFVRFRYCDLMCCGIVAVACFGVGCLRVIGGFGWGFGGCAWFSVWLLVSVVDLVLLLIVLVVFVLLGLLLVVCLWALLCYFVVVILWVGLLCCWG